MKTSVLAWLAGKIKKRMGMLIGLTVLQVGLAVFGVLIAVESKRMLDAAVGGESMKEAFLIAIVTLVALVLFLLLFRYVSADLKERLLIELDRDWKIELFAKLLNGSYQDVQQYHSGELVNRLAQDVDTVDQGIVTVVPGIFAMVTRLVGAAVVLFMLEPLMTAVLLAVGILMIVSTTALRRILKEYHKRVAASNGKVNGFIQEALEKLLIVQAMDVAEEMEQREKTLLDERKKVQTRRKTYSLLGMTGMNVIMNVLYYGALIVCAIQLFRGDIMIGTLTAVTQLVGQLQAPFTGLSAMINAYLSMKGSAERLKDLTELKDREQSEADPESLYEQMDALKGREITFTYPDDTVPTIKNLTFSVPKGAFYAVTGESGIGKSTLLKLLLGIYRLEKGSILAGAEPVSGATRRLFSYVPQGNLLISGTLRENLLLTKPEATEEEVRRALELSCLKETVDELPDGLNTMLKENGTGISEGQAQRLSIARAILRDAPILLLDEATSALDEATEMKVLDQLKNMKGKTIIAVTHRPYAREIADGEIRFE